MSKFQSLVVTRQYLTEHPDHIFVFGDNCQRKGLGGAAKLRYLLNAYGFITKKKPDNKDSSFYKADDYEPVFEKELAKLIEQIEGNPDKTYLITKLGSGLANRYHIWDVCIRVKLKKTLEKYDNVIFLTV